MSPAMADFLERSPRPHHGDLDPAGKQLELFQALLNAVAGDLPPRGRDVVTARQAGVSDVAGWLCEQSWCSVQDWLAVASLWGGDRLRDHLLARLERMSQVLA
jgi:hypothetical protein